MYGGFFYNNRKNQMKRNSKVTVKTSAPISNVKNQECLPFFIGHTISFYIIQYIRSNTHEAMFVSILF